MIPESAVSRGREGARVFVVNEDNDVARATFEPARWWMACQVIAGRA
jgi:hypothetical protein